MINFIIYTGPSCTKCLAVKQLMKEKGFGYDEISVESEEAGEFLKSNPTVQALPIVVNLDDNSIIAGDDAVEYFLNK